MASFRVFTVLTSKRFIYRVENVVDIRCSLSYMYIATMDQHIVILVSGYYNTNDILVLSKTPINAIEPTKCSQQKQTTKCR